MDTDHGTPFDQEIRRRLVFATGIGILALTLVAMVLMWWLSAALKTSAESQGSPLTEIQATRKKQTEQENELQAQVDRPVFPQLLWPREVAYPGGPDFDHEPYPPDRDVPGWVRLQVAPGRDMAGFLEDQRAIQQSVGWDDPVRRTAHLPLAAAVDEVLSGSRESGQGAGAKTGEPDLQTDAGAGDGAGVGG